VTTHKKGDAQANAFIPSEARGGHRIARDIGGSCATVAFANRRHRHRISRPRRANRSDPARLEIFALSGADSLRASPLHARTSRSSRENAPNLRLVGGWRSLLRTALGVKFPGFEAGGGSRKPVIPPKLFGGFPRNRNREFQIGNRQSMFPDRFSIRESIVAPIQLCSSLPRLGSPYSCAIAPTEGRPSPSKILRLGVRKHELRYDFVGVVAGAARLAQIRLPAAERSYT
jgi:hypothetical protein